MKVLEGTFNQKKALIAAFSVIVKSSRRFVCSSGGGAGVVERVKVGELLEIVELWPGLYTAACCWRTLALSAGEAEGCCGHQAGMVEL